jgi:large subunit ribosomal protein L53
MLKHLKRVFVKFAPTDPRATSARELLQRVGCDKARKSNPECQVEFQADNAVGPNGSYVELLFVDDEQRQLRTADLKIDDIVRIIQQKATEMELRSVMKDVKYDPFKAENRIAPR